VWFVPAALQPLKPGGPQASNADRIAMLQQITDNTANFDVCSLEIDRGGVSYTFETLQSIRNQQPEAELFFLMGADSLEELSQWRRPEDICRLATPLVVRRAGKPQPDFDSLRPLVSAERLSEIRRCQVEMDEVPISSSQIRGLIKEQGDWQSLVPAEVAAYIVEHSLYGIV